MKHCLRQTILFVSLLLFSCYSHCQQRSNTLWKDKTPHQVLQGGQMLSRTGNVMVAGGLGLCLGGLIWMANAFEYQGNEAFTVAAVGGGIGHVGLTTKIIGSSKVRRTKQLLGYDNYQNSLNQPLGMLKLGVAIPLH